MQTNSIKLNAELQALILAFEKLDRDQKDCFSEMMEAVSGEEQAVRICWIK